MATKETDKAEIDDAAEEAVKVDKDSHKAVMYPEEKFREVVEVNLIAPVYWAMEMVARVAEQRAAAGLKRWHPDERIQGTVIFIGSVP